MSRVRERHRRDFAAYLRWYRLTRPPRAVVDRGEMSALQAYILQDSTGRTQGTRQPRLLGAVLAGKADLNLHVRIWAEGLADCGGEAWIAEAQESYPWLPEWVWTAVRRAA